MSSLNSNNINGSLKTLKQISTSGLVYNQKKIVAIGAKVKKKNLLTEVITM